jgi:hypothetical protein
MHDHGGRGGPARRPRRRWRPYLAALVAVLALALAVAACGGGDKPSGVASLGDGSDVGNDFRQALAFARCLRQHGINVPDPRVSGDGIDQQFPEGAGPNAPKFRAAEQACAQSGKGGK